MSKKPFVTKEQVEELFKLGIHKVCTTKAYEILKK